MPYVNIDKAVKHIKTIVDSNRCPNCDKLNGDRLRYSCGHVICRKCAEDYDECLICIDSSENCDSQIDKVKGQQVQNAARLLTSFQDAFKVDVYKRYRLSEKLKIEEEVFPKTIPVSATYFNKRKSFQSPTKENKENIFHIDGEATSNLDLITMNTRANLVKKWFDGNEKFEKAERKPFSDVNSPLRRTRVTNMVNNESNKSFDRKRNAKKKSTTEKLKVREPKSVKQEKYTKHVLSQSLLRSYVEKDVKLQVETHPACMEGETGNLDNELDIIDLADASSPVIDKDRQALLAVLQADNSGNPDNNSTITRNDNSVPQSKYGNNVCFYKKYFLFKSCYYCLNSCKKYNLENQRLTSNDVSLSFKTDNDNIITTVSLINNYELYKNNMLSKHSIAVQTEENYTDEDTIVSNKVIPSLQNDFHSNVNNEKLHRSLITERDFSKIPNLSQNIIISDSDSDIDMNSSESLTVTADVHRSSDIYDGVLSSVDTSNYKSRLRKSKIRETIDSNNSSEKENVEPNKPKKLRPNKKNGQKK